MRPKHVFSVLFLILMALALSACVSDLPSRSDMPIRGDRVVDYKITQPAGSERVDNVATLRGTGDTGVPPFSLLSTVFSAQQGLKTQDILLGAEQILGMTKPDRGIGWSRFAEYEPATQCTHDAAGVALCGTKVRIKFNQNAVQLVAGADWDFDALMYYTIPATWNGGNDYRYDVNEAQFVSVTINQVTQFRLGWGKSWFHNWGHSIVVTGGEPAKMRYGFWRETQKKPGSYNDLHDAVQMLSSMVRDAAESEDPWLEFSGDGDFSDSTIVYSAGDADTYATPQRLLLNRQRQYAVFYRPNVEVEWDWVTVVPQYNFEFNDFGQIFGENVLGSILNKDGTLKSSEGNNSTLRELEKIGCQNCPNASLEQVKYYDSEGELLYTFTFRAYHGANDTLLISGPALDKWEFQNAPMAPLLPRPIDYSVDGDGKVTKKATSDQTFPDDKSWSEYLAEATIWEWLRSDNPINADLYLQFRVNDSSEWAPIPCSDGGTCGYRPVRWNLESNYFFDGEVETPWLLLQLLGEVGMRTLGFSYVSGRYEGSGIEFAMDQVLFHEWQNVGFPNEEAVFMFDARALTTPRMLALQWETLQSQRNR